MLLGELSGEWSLEDNHLITASAIEKFQSVVGVDNFLLDEESLFRYSLDAYRVWSSQGRFSTNNKVSAVVKPLDTQEIVKIVKIANQEKIPLIPFGSGTGVMGAINPVPGSVCVDLKRMKSILDIDPVSLTVTAQSGVILAQLDESLSKRDLMLGHDPYSLPIATVGGAISTSGVGYRAAKYGSMGDQVLGLQVVLPNGEILETRSVEKTSVGPGFQYLFIGTEGVFGFITQATLKVFRIPESRVFKTYSFDNFENGFNAMNEMFSIGLKPSLSDLTEECSDINNSNQTKGQYSTNLFLVFEGYCEEVKAQLSRVPDICSQYGGTDAGPSMSKNYWDKRHDSAYRFKDNYIKKSVDDWPIANRNRVVAYPHVALPASKVLEYRRLAEQIVLEFQVEITEYSCWTNPGLFSLMLVKTVVDWNKDVADLDIAVDKLLTLAQDLGGTMEYVHGVGSKLSHLVSRELGYGLEIMRKIKSSIDPENIINPNNLGM
jgi:alkyldihydroxyacetonephosphate synthase